MDMDEILAPMGLASFEADVRGRQMLHLAGLPDRFDALLGWRSLDALIRDRAPRAPHFRVMRDGVPLNEQRYYRTTQTLRGPLSQIDPSRLLAELRNEGTLVWDAIDRGHRPIREVTHAVERGFGVFAFANAYASWGSRSGVGSHWDDHDVFVLQLVGRKRWQIAPPERPAPLPGDPDGVPPDRFAHDLTLQPGDLLYLPRGWWHHVTPLGGPCLHLTMGMLQPNNRDFLEWLVHSLNEEAVLREDFPTSTDPEALENHAQALARTMAKAITPAAFVDFAQAHRIRQMGDPWPSLTAVATRRPVDWPEDTALILLYSRAILRAEGENVMLDVGAVEWRLPIAARPCLETLLCGETVFLSELRKVLDDDLIAGLVEDGILALT